MDDFPRSEPPRFWIAFGLMCAALLLAFVMVVFTSIHAHAQGQPLCAPADVLLRQFAQIHKEQPVWEGVVPQDTGPVEVVLLQGKNTWTLFTIRDGIACILAAGRDGTEIQTGKGV